jgi:hypothetical protein
MDNYNYPIGLNTKDAPWNQVDNPEKEIEVTVSITLSKTVKIKVNDYEITGCSTDDEGYCFDEIDYSNCNLKEAVEEQVFLPQEAGLLIKDFDIKTRKADAIVEDLSNWSVDEMEVIME